MADKLIGIQAEESGDFLCAASCLSDDQTEELLAGYPNSKGTPIYDSDDWFTGETCKQCGDFVEGGRS